MLTNDKVKMKDNKDGTNVSEDPSNNNNVNFSKERRKSKEEAGSNKNAQNAIILGLIGGLVALLMKSSKVENEHFY